MQAPNQIFGVLHSTAGVCCFLIFGSPWGTELVRYRTRTSMPQWKRQLNFSPALCRAKH